jgi:hypothetical protein
MLSTYTAHIRKQRNNRNRRHWPFSQQFSLWTTSGGRVRAPGLQKGGFVGVWPGAPTRRGLARAIMRIAGVDVFRG